MEVEFVCDEGEDLGELLKRYPDLHHEDTYDGVEHYWIGKSGDDYYDTETGRYTAEEDDEQHGMRQHDKEWMSWSDAVEFCGFATELIPTGATLLEGNGPWAQGQLRETEDYKRGQAKAREING